MTSQKENYNAIFDAKFNLFAPSNIGFEQLPPLQNAFGSIQYSDNVIPLLNAGVNNQDIDQPLLCFVDKSGKRSAFLFGENTWKWRLESHLIKKSFDDYDAFIDKVIQYLATNSNKKSLVVEHERFYNSGESIEIFAQYFNKNYELDENANLIIQLVNKKTKQTKKYSFSKANNGNKVIFDGLEPGDYSFVVKEITSNASYTGGFEVLDFDVEKQFVNPDRLRLEQLASQTSGKVYYPNQINALIKNLLEKNTYLPVQKELIKASPLIDWVTLLIILAISLALEWFIRKYNGLL
jgi:hypothetical protein